MNSASFRLLLRRSKLHPSSLTVPAMSYASLIQTLPETLRSSTGLAVLTSVGLHGLLLAVLPVLPLDSKSVEADLQRTVGLVELTPAEQSRLPQSSTPSVTLPSFATQPSVLPPLPPPPSSLNLLPSSRTPVYKYPLAASLPQLQTLRVPLSAQNNQSFTSLFPFGKLPDPTMRQTTPQQQILPSLPPLQQQTLPPPPPLFKLPANTSLPYLRLKPAERFSLPDIPPSPTAQENTDLQVASSNLNNRPANPSERGREELVAALQQRLRQQSNSNSDGSTSQNTRTSPEANLPATSARPANAPERGREELVAALQQQLRQQSSNSNPAGSTTSAATAEKLAQLSAWSERQNRVQKKNPSLVKKRPIYKTFKTCKRELEGMAVLGVVVNPEGNIVSGPDLLHKKGATGIEQVAKNYVKGYGFPRTNNLTNQEFNLQYKYNTGNCAEASQKPAPENTNTSEPKPAPENTNTSEPKLAPENTNTSEPKLAPENTNTSEPEPAPENTNTSEPEPAPENTDTEQLNS